MAIFLSGSQEIKCEIQHNTFEILHFYNNQQETSLRGEGCKKLFSSETRGFKLFAPKDFFGDEKSNLTPRHFFPVNFRQVRLLVCFPKVSQDTVAKEVSQGSHQTLHPCSLFRCLGDLWDISLNQQRAIQKPVQIPWTGGEVEQESIYAKPGYTLYYHMNLGLRQSTKKNKHKYPLHQSWHKKTSVNTNAPGTSVGQCCATGFSQT